ncbi:MAG TPA: cation-transporting P-type ATPase [Gammaproteobacteria bacterium]|nr:cation-transporting P-type ATPase [Gammaproteobacteria bacterium]
MNPRQVPRERIEGLGPQDGLAIGAVEERRRRYGNNDIVEAPPGGLLVLLRVTARDPMLWFLLGTAAVFVGLADYTEALVLGLATIPFAGMDAWLHRRTRASTAGLASRLAAGARARRGGAVIRIAAAELVPGDLVEVAAGEPFPADGLLVAGEDLQAEESTLTGEAFPVRKLVLDALPEGPVPVVDEAHWGLAGTRLLTGHARLRIVYTGRETLYGEIVRSARAGEQSRTPLQRAIAHLVAGLVVAAGAMCLVLAWVRLQQGHGVLDAVISAVTLAVAALPEEFPVVFTFFLGVGVYRLARRQALVRRAVAVENIGRVGCICSDKTGTLTEGRLRLAHVHPVEPLTAEALVAHAALACRPDSGDPVDQATLGKTHGPVAVPVRARFPFSEERARETAVVHLGGTLRAVTKGAPEVVLALCDLPAAQRQRWLARVDEIARDGHRVLACAARDLSDGNWAGGEPDRGFGLLGLLAYEDPVREGVVEAVRECQRAGIHVIMVTGDHAATAEAVAREIGLGGARPRVVSGEVALEHAIRGTGWRSVDVVARAVPSQKLSLVRAIQADGTVVAVTGDGVNDVPALQAADIGIAMGERGTRSAREVAAVVLLDDNFRTIVRAVAEGRALFRNLRLSFRYLLMVHIPLVVTATLIPLAGQPLLYLPIHVVWLEMIIHPTAMLVFQELPAEGPLEAVDGAPRVRFFRPGEWAGIVATGGLLALLVAGAYGYALGAGGNVPHARAMALATLIFSGAGLTAALSRLRTFVARVVVAASAAGSLALIQVPALARPLHLSPLHLSDWGLVMLGVVAVTASAGLPGTRKRRRPRPGDLGEGGAGRAR